MPLNGIHVVTNPSGGWSVRKTGAIRASKVFDKQAEAVIYAREIARAKKGELYIHRSNGQIRSKDSYGKDIRVFKD